MPTTLRGKLLLVFYVGVLLTVSGFGAIYLLVRDHQTLTEQSLELPEATALWGQLDAAVERSQVLLRDVVQQQQPPDVLAQQWNTEVESTLERIQQLYRRDRVWQEERAVETRTLYDTRLLLRSLQGLQEEVGRAAPEAASVRLRDEVEPLVREVRGSMASLIRQQLDLSRSNLRDLQRNLLELNARMGAAALLMLLGLSLLAWVLAKQVVNPLRTLQQAIRQFKEDRLQGQLNLKRQNDEIGDLAEEFEQMAAAIQDRTRQLERSHEELSQAYRDLNGATQARSEFFAGMSHDLRTPLNAIIGFADALLQESPDDPLTPYQADRLGRILKSGRQLLEMLNALLDLSKIEAGRMPLHPERFNLTQCLRETVQLLEPLMHQKQLSCDLTAAADPWWCHTDEGKVRQIVQNLLGNAIKFTPNGGALQVLAVAEGEWVRLQVVDSGIGIPDSEQERVFDLFRQVEDRSRSHQGSGLGLALVRSMTDLLEGTVSLKSDEGVGSTFTVRFPAVHPQTLSTR